MKRFGLLSIMALAALTVACDDAADDTAAALSLQTSPQYVNRIIPGTRPLALVSVDTDADDAVELTGTASLSGAEVSFQPASVSAIGVAEVWVTLPETADETPFTVTVTATVDSTNAEVTIDATAIPGTDDLGPTAITIVDVFLDEMEGLVPGLPASGNDLANGTPVAGLLVVSHYAWFTDEYEIGLAWHIMIAPDDFAELYLRPRDEAAPTMAFRIDTWSTALAGGDFTFSEVDPPAEVTR